MYRYKTLVSNSPPREDSHKKYDIFYENIARISRHLRYSALCYENIIQYDMYSILVNAKYFYTYN